METPLPDAKPIEILFSYAHEDEKLKDRLEVYLAVLKRNKRIICWDDRQIRAGKNWELTISEHLDTADIILLLVSPDFMNSEYCNTIEVKRALERHEKGEACVIPVILRRADWQDEKFAKLQATPPYARPVKEWPDPELAFYEIAREIKKVVEDMEKARKPSV